MKYLILKCPSEASFREALLTWRNTPRADGLSPAQLFFGFTLNFGQSPDFAAIYIDRHTATTTRNDSFSKTKNSFDNSTVSHSILDKHDRVRIQDPKTKRWPLKGTILDTTDHKRSYIIACDDGNTITRNRRLVKPLPP